MSPLPYPTNVPGWKTVMMPCWLPKNWEIPFQTVDLSKEYKERIVDYMFDEYAQGRTPNPDVLCNREIKFDVFLEISLFRWEPIMSLQGHYCQKESFSK